MKVPVPFIHLTTLTRSKKKEAACAASWRSTNLERVFQLKPDLASSFSTLESIAKGAAVQQVEVNSTLTSTQPLIRMVKGIEHFRPQLHFMPLQPRNAKTPCDRKGPILASWIHCIVAAGISNSGLDPPPYAAC